MPSSGGQTCALDRKSTRLNSSHTIISYAVFCLEKKGAQGRDVGIRERVLGSDESRGLTRDTLACMRRRRAPAAAARPPPTHVRSALFFVMIRHQPRAPLFPYTTLFR